MSSGVDLAIISGRQSLAVKKRTRELGIKHVYQGVTDKLPIYSKLIAKLNLGDSQVAYIGDDYPDLPIMKRCGLSITVPHATDLIKTNSNYTTVRPGGNGAVREVCELIMVAQGTFGKQTGKYLR